MWPAAPTGSASDLYSGGCGFDSCAWLHFISIKVNGKAIDFTPEKGCCDIAREWKKGDVVEIEMNMPVKRIKAHDQAKVNSDRLAVERGSILYCAEGVDNAGKVCDKVIAADAEFERTSCNC